MLATEIIDYQAESVSIASVREAVACEWDSIWENCKYSTYFHSREWAEIWNAYTGGKMRPTPQLLFFSDGKTALLPLSLERAAKGLTYRCVSSPAGTFGGWISTDDLHLPHALLLAAYLKKQRATFTWRLNPYDPLARVAVVEPSMCDETQVLDLSGGFDNIYARWTKGHASAARKALREGVTVKQANALDDWRSYYEVYEDSLRRWGEKTSSKYSWRIFGDMFRLNSPRIKLWLAVYQEKVIAGALCFYAPKHVVYWHGAALESYFSLRPVHLLMLEAIKDACEGGFAWFDFNPSGGYDGVRAFKRSFGTIEMPAPVLQRESRFFRIATYIARMARSLGL